jgi:hypothetical protein
MRKIVWKIKVWNISINAANKSPKSKRETKNNENAE